MKKCIYPLIITLTFCTALAQQPAQQKEPMGLATAWANVVAACKAAQMDVLTGRQGVVVDESLRRLAPVLASYETYRVDIEKLIGEKRGSEVVNSEVVTPEAAPKVEAETE